MELLKLSIDEQSRLAGVISVWLIFLILAIVAIAIALPWVRNIVFRQEFEIDEVELGVGSGKLKFKPNSEDLQIAYKLWVELKTRKLGLPFEEDHDVIVEIYNSWYEFFKITRELIKLVPIAKIRGQESTQLLIGISIDVLNKAIRPHLTKWQARYRHWLEVELKKQGRSDIAPQELQKQFPEYKTLVADLKRTNAQLVAYAKILAEILELGAKATREPNPTH
jgi:hypothetical protein